MAFTASDFDQMRHEVSRDLTTPCLKSQINAALQAIDTYITDSFTTRPAASLNVVLNNATAPVVFSAAEKFKLVNTWLRIKYKTGGF